MEAVCTGTYHGAHHQCFFKKIYFPSFPFPPLFLCLSLSLTLSAGLYDGVLFMLDSTMEFHLC